MVENKLERHGGNSWQWEGRLDRYVRARVFDAETTVRAVVAPCRGG
jgi:hypothetical protein